MERQSDHYLQFLGNTQLEVKAGAILKDWHPSVTEVLRLHLVQRIVEKVLPKSNISPYQDPRILTLTAYARKVEGDMYYAANSRDEYYELIVEQMMKILKQLDEGSSLESVIGDNSGEQSTNESHKML